MTERQVLEIIVIIGAGLLALGISIDKVLKRLDAIERLLRSRDE